MIGDGPLRTSCEEFVIQANLPVHFTGFSEPECINHKSICRRSAPLALPSDGGETLGLVVNEAMSCGLPAFVSDHVGCGPDMIKGKETGYVFPLERF